MVNQFYQKKKEEKLRKEARERCQNVSEVEKEKKTKIGLRQIMKCF